MGQILIQVSAFHVLGDHAEGVVADTHPQKTDDVGILQAGQDLDLFQEVIPARAKSEQRLFRLFLLKATLEKEVTQGSGSV